MNELDEIVFDIECGSLFRGALFRFKRLVPEEEIVEYLLFQNWEASGLGLVRDCGYEAGLVLVVLPTEARAEGAVGISPQWLAHHWQKWVDSSSSPDEVWVLKDGRSAPEALPDEEFRRELPQRHNERPAK